MENQVKHTIPRDLKRRAYIGFTAGLLSSVLLVSTFRNAPLALALAASVGTIFALAFRPAPKAYLDSLMTGATWGVPLWTCLSVVAVPVIAGRGRSGQPTLCAVCFLSSWAGSHLEARWE